MSYGIMDQLVSERRSELARAASEHSFGRRAALAKGGKAAHKSFGQEVGSILVRMGTRLGAGETRHAGLGTATR